MDETPESERHERRVPEPEGRHENQGLPFGDIGPRREGGFLEETPQVQAERVQEGGQPARDRQEHNLAHRRTADRDGSSVD
jgi:hypothetical protein